MHYLMQFILSGGGTGGQNLPPPVPCSPASRRFISRLPPFTMLLPCLGLRSPARLQARPSDRVRLKNANYANFLGEIVRLERPIVQ